MKARFSREYLDLRNKNKEEVAKNYVMKIFLICKDHQIISRCQKEEEAMNAKCETDKKHTKL
jgi:hypothetical protein